MHDQHRAAEQAARESFGRLVAWLAWQWRDVAAAEDAMADALLKALEVWPEQGIPQSPDAWLLTVAKRQLLQSARHERLRLDPAVTVLLEQEEAEPANWEVPDERLRLMLVCAHPAIDEKIRTALMLQTVLGLQADEIAGAMLLSPTTLAQRLVRAKQKIRDSGLRFETPQEADLPARVQFVLESIYAAYGVAADALDGAEARISDLREEAIYLCGLIVTALPDSAEAKGLLGLMKFAQARRAAKYSPGGAFIPLTSQDVGQWDRKLIVEADQLLWAAAQLRTPGPFQLEAAIQSAHSQRLFTGVTPWNGIAQLYAQINAHFPTEGSRVAGAVASAEAGDVAGGLAQLAAIDEASRRNYQPWWVARAHLLALNGEREAAANAFTTAIGLSTQPPIREHLAARRRALDAN